MAFNPGEPVSETNRLPITLIGASINLDESTIVAAAVASIRSTIVAPTFGARSADPVAAPDLATTDRVADLESAYGVNVNIVPLAEGADITTRIADAKAKHRVVTLPPGNWTVQPNSAALTADLDGTTFRAPWKRATKLTPTSNVAGYMVSVAQGVENAKVEGIIFSAPSSLMSAVGISLGAHGTEVAHCTCENMKLLRTGNGFFTAGYYGAEGDFVVRNLHVHHCHGVGDTLSTSGQNQFMYLNSCVDFHVHDCSARDYYGCGIQWQGSADLLANDTIQVDSTTANTIVINHNSANPPRTSTPRPSTIFHIFRAPANGYDDGSKINLANTGNGNDGVKTITAIAYNTPSAGKATITVAETLTAAASYASAVATQASPYTDSRNEYNYLDCFRGVIERVKTFNCGAGVWGAGGRQIDVNDCYDEHASDVAYDTEGGRHVRFNRCHSIDPGDADDTGAAAVCFAMFWGNHDCEFNECIGEFVEVVTSTDAPTIGQTVLRWGAGSNRTNPPHPVDAQGAGQQNFFRLWNAILDGTGQSDSTTTRNNKIRGCRFLARAQGSFGFLPSISNNGGPLYQDGGACNGLEIEGCFIHNGRINLGYGGDINHKVVGNKLLLDTAPSKAQDLVYIGLAGGTGSQVRDAYKHTIKDNEIDVRATMPVGSSAVHLAVGGGIINPAVWTVLFKDNDISALGNVGRFSNGLRVSNGINLTALSSMIVAEGNTFPMDYLTGGRPVNLESYVGTGYQGGIPLSPTWFVDNGGNVLRSSTVEAVSYPHQFPTAVIEHPVLSVPTTNTIVVNTASISTADLAPGDTILGESFVDAPNNYVHGFKIVSIAQNTPSANQATITVFGPALTVNATPGASAKVTRVIPGGSKELVELWTPMGLNTITGVSSGGVYTCSAATTALRVGSIVYVFGCTNADNNGYQTVTALGANTFTASGTHTAETPGANARAAQIQNNTLYGYGLNLGFPFEYKCARNLSTDLWDFDAKTHAAGGGNLAIYATNLDKLPKKLPTGKMRLQWGRRPY